MAILQTLANQSNIQILAFNGMGNFLFGNGARNDFKALTRALECLLEELTIHAALYSDD